jgi:hypothetical protein
MRNTYKGLTAKFEGKKPVWRKLLKWIVEKWDDGVDWIKVAQNRDQWRGLMNSLMNLRVP